MPKWGSPEERFWRFVEKTETCWLWTGVKMGGKVGGYGSFRTGSKQSGGTMVPAHRFAWELMRGEIPPKVFVLHRCDVRHCVNPDHLFLGSKLDNAQDRDAKGRGFVTIPEEIVNRIRADHAAGYRVTEIARVLGLSHAHVGQIILGKARR